MRRLMMAVSVAALSFWTLMLGGCSVNKTLVFSTATKFGLDVSQRADQTVDITMGYDRYELASVPAQETDAKKGADADAYSVLGVFSLSYGNPWSDEPLILRQFFATGWAARLAADQKSFRQFFGRKTGEIILEADREIKAQRAQDKQP